VSDLPGPGAAPSPESFVPRLRVLPHRLAVCRLPADAPIPAWVLHASAEFWCMMRTAHELSVVCPEDDLPPSVETAEKPWRVFELVGPVPFTTTGVIAALTAPLAEALVPVFVLSTYDTDYLLVKERYFDQARALLAARFTLE
jgi:hypothetical protein